MTYKCGSQATAESIERALDEAFLALFKGCSKKPHVNQRIDWLKSHGAQHTVKLAAYMMGCSYDAAQYAYKKAGVKPKNGWGKN